MLSEEQYNLSPLVLLQPQVLPQLLILIFLVLDSPQTLLAVVPLQRLVDAHATFAIGTLVHEAHEQLRARVVVRADLVRS